MLRRFLPVSALVPATSAESEPVGGNTEYGWCLESVAPKLHTERVTSMIWIGNVLVSGDKVIVEKAAVLCSCGLSVHWSLIESLNMLLSSYLEYPSDNVVWRGQCLET